jgi:hypothetical protein
MNSTTQAGHSPGAGKFAAAAGAVSPEVVPTNFRRIHAAWPQCYHITYNANIPSIRDSRSLFPADVLFRAAGECDLSRERRTRDLLLRIGRHKVIIRNQCPLDPMSLDLAAGYTVQDYIACLNSRAYFWPGTISAPVEDGLRMLCRASTMRSTIIRIPTQSLIQANATSTPYVSTCNSGAAWTECGQKSRRGPDVFQSIECFSGRLADIAEISFAGPVCLPIDATYADHPSGPWRVLLCTRHLPA